MGLAKIPTSVEAIGLLVKGREKFLTKLTGSCAKDAGLVENLVAAGKKTGAVPFRLLCDDFSEASAGYQLTTLLGGSYIAVTSTTGSLKNANTAMGVRTRTVDPEISATYNAANGLAKAGTAAAFALAVLKPKSAVSKLLCKAPGLLLAPYATTKSADIYEQHVLEGNSIVDRFLKNGYDSVLEDHMGGRLRGPLYDICKLKDEDWFGIGITRRPEFYHQLEANQGEITFRPLD